MDYKFQLRREREKYNMGGIIERSGGGKGTVQDSMTWEGLKVFGIRHQSTCYDSQD